MFKQNSSIIFAKWKSVTPFVVKIQFSEVKQPSIEYDSFFWLPTHKSSTICSTQWSYNQFIAFCRDETTLLLPDVEKEDFQKLVKNLYGEAGSEKPSVELLRLLQIDRLPDESPISNLAETSTTTLISKLFCY